MKHLDFITVPLDRLRFGVEDKHRNWWGFDRMIETWEILDKHPETPIKELPLYHLHREVGEKIYNVKPNKSTTVGVENCKALYFDIRDNGFDETKGHILIRIRDNGVIYVVNGHHRVSILKHLKYNEICVKVKTRNRGFRRFKEELHQIYGEMMLYQPVDHPDLSDWSLNQNGYEEVFQLITENVVVQDKTILDIGSCTGDFSYKLTKLGGEVTGIDTDDRVVKLAEYQRTYRNADQCNPVFLVKSFESHLPTSRSYDVVLLLNVIHHYLRNSVDDALNRLVDISKKTSVLIIQLDTKIPITIPELVDKIMITTDFNSHQIHYIPNHPSRPVLIFKKEGLNDYTL